ncbi:hypothetical protein CO709_27390 [Burkholderia thailandensis]|nr:hypothetical protein CO709_27390 [Burkholderia thailandensis]
MVDRSPKETSHVGSRSARAVRDGDSTVRGDAQLTVELLRNFSDEGRRTTSEGRRAAIRRI